MMNSVLLGATVETAVLYLVNLIERYKCNHEIAQQNGKNLKEKKPRHDSNTNGLLQTESLENEEWLNWAKRDRKKKEIPSNILFNIYTK